MSIQVIGKCRIYYELHGPANGEPLALVHGSWGDHRDWGRVVEEFARHFHVLIYDRRGHSGSTCPGSQGSAEEDAADLGQLIEGLGLAPAHVAGNSFGASIVLRLAGKRPELFKSIIAHEPPLFDLLEGDPRYHALWSAGRKDIAEVAELLGQGKFEEGAQRFVDTVALGPGAWKRLTPGARRTFIANAPTFLDEMRDPDGLRLDLAPLRTLLFPALLSTGANSPPIYAPVLDCIAAAMGNPVRVVFPEAGHVPQTTHPEEFVRIIKGFLKTHGSK